MNQNYALHALEIALEIGHFEIGFLLDFSLLSKNHGDSPIKYATETGNIWGIVLLNCILINTLRFSCIVGPSFVLSEGIFIQAARILLLLQLSPCGRH